jgi:hypothetical protein
LVVKSETLLEKEIPTPKTEIDGAENFKALAADKSKFRAVPVFANLPGRPDRVKPPISLSRI